MSGLDNLSDIEFLKRARGNIRIEAGAYKLYHSSTLTKTGSALTLFIETIIPQLKWQHKVEELEKEFSRRGLPDSGLCGLYRNLINKTKEVLDIFDIDEQLLILSEKPLMRTGIAFKGRKEIDFVCWDSNRKTIRPVKLDESTFREKLSEVGGQGITIGSLTDRLEKSDVWHAYKKICQEIYQSFNDK